MAIALYMDEHIPKAITDGLRVRGIDVITAQEDGSNNLSDSVLLDRATTIQRVLFVFDDDLLSEATKRQREGIPFAGVIYAHPLRISIGTCIHDLEMIAKAGVPEDLINRVMFLPI
jgi:hypothetical protein